MKTDVVMLAAGLSSRMGPADKMLLEYGGMHLCSWCCFRALDFLAGNPGGGRLIVVTGFRRPEVLEVLKPCFEKAEKIASVSIEEAFNPRYEDGQFTSAQRGALEVLPDTDFFISLADMPDIQPSFYSLLIPHLEGYDAVRPFVNKSGIPVPGHPVLLSPHVRAMILSCSPDCTMKSVLESCHVNSYMCGSENGWIRDIDTPNDL